MTEPEPEPAPALHHAVVTDAGLGPYVEIASDGRHGLIVDEPGELEGQDLGPTPYSLLLMALGSCTAITLRMYAARKAWPLERVRVRLTHSRDHLHDCATVETPSATLDRIERVLELSGRLDRAQRERLKAIAEMCPVHKALAHGLPISTSLADAD